MSVKVWVVGKSLPSAKPFDRWELAGVFSSREEAIRQIGDYKYWLVSTTLDYLWPDETTDFTDLEVPNGVPDWMLEVR